MNTANQPTSNSDKTRYSIGVNFDVRVDDWDSFEFPTTRDSKDVKELERAGYKVIFPAELSKDAVAAMDEHEKEQYEVKKNRALVIDPQEQCHSLDLANAIASHYYSCSHGTLCGVDYNTNALAIFPFGNFDESAHSHLHKLFTDLGFAATFNDYQLSVSSDVPYPCVTKSKLGQIYQSAKDKIHSVLSNMGLIKDKQKANRDDHSQSI